MQPKPRLNSSRALQHFMPRLMLTAHCASPTGPAAAGISRLGGEQSGLVCLPCRPARGHRTWGRAVERTTRPGIYVTRQAAGLWTLAVCSLAREEEKSMLSLTASLISKQNRGKQNRNQSTPPLLSGPSWSGSGRCTGHSEIRVTRATPERVPGVTPASSSLLQFGAEVPLPTVAPAFLGLPRRRGAHRASRPQRRPARCWPGRSRRRTLGGSVL